MLKVVIDRDLGTEVVLKNGLKGGEKVVTSAPVDLTEGAKVKLAPSNGAAASGSAPGSAPNVSKAQTGTATEYRPFRDPAPAENFFDNEEPSSREGVGWVRSQSDRGDVKMNKENLEGNVRSVVGQGEKLVGQATNDRGTTAQGYYDDAAGKARSAYGSAKDAVSGGVDAISSLDFSGLRDEISKLTQQVSDLAQTQISAGRNQVAGAMGAAGDSLSQSAASAQDKLTAIEGDVESRESRKILGARWPSPP